MITRAALREIVVDDSSDTTTVPPNAGIDAIDADTEIILGKYGFSPLGALRAGRHQFKVTNARLFPHQVLLIRFPDAVDEREEANWFRDNYRTARPGRPSGGVTSTRA